MKAIDNMVKRAAFCDGNSNCFPDTPDPTEPPATTTTTQTTGPTTTPDPQLCQPNEVIFRPFPSKVSIN
jgi:hypothetical protein